MFGAGAAAQAMINSIRNNKKLLRRKRLFTRERSFLNLRKAYYKKAGGALELKKASPAQLAKIREKVLRQRKQEAMTMWVIGIFIASLGYYFLYELAKNDQATTEKIRVIEFKKQSEEYLFFIEDGDAWLEKKHWNNAIFQYKKALEIFPAEYDANYRLALAYYNKCLYKNKSCSLGKELTQKLARQYPKKQEVVKLVSLFEEKLNK